MVAELCVCLLADGVVDLGVRGHFGASVFACPTLSRRDKFGSDSLPAMIAIDKPAFEIADVFGLAILDVVTNARFEKTREPSGTRVCDRDKLRIGMLDDIDHLDLVIVLARLIPQKCAKTQPFGKVTLF